MERKASHDRGPVVLYWNNYNYNLFSYSNVVREALFSFLHRGCSVLEILVQMTEELTCGLALV